MGTGENQAKNCCQFLYSHSKNNMIYTYVEFDFFNIDGRRINMNQEIKFLEKLRELKGIAGKDKMTDDS